MGAGYVSNFVWLVVKLQLWKMCLDRAVHWESSQLLKLEQDEQEKKVILDYNPMYKINIHESLLI